MIPEFQIFLVIALAGYFTGSVGYVLYLVKHREEYHRFGHVFFLTGLIIHSLVMFTCFVSSGYLPVENLRSTLAFSGWTLAVVYAAFHLRFRLMVLGAVVGPVVCLLVGIASAMPHQAYSDPDLLRGIWVFFHILAIFLGDAAFVLAALVGGIYLLQERAIKTKNHGFFFRRLPSLEILDRMGYALVAFGFPLLTIGLATGFIYAQSVWGRWWSGDPKEVWSLATWLLYAALLHERLTVGWRGRRAAWMAILGLIFLLFTFLGVNLLMTGHHGQFN